MRRYGSKKPSRASQRAAAIGLIVAARVTPTVETLVRSYGLTPGEATDLLDQHRRGAALL